MLEDIFRESASSYLGRTPAASPGAAVGAAALGAEAAAAAGHIRCRRRRRFSGAVLRPVGQ